MVKCEFDENCNEPARFYQSYNNELKFYCQKHQKVIEGNYFNPLKKRITQRMYENLKKTNKERLEDGF